MLCECDLELTFDFAQDDSACRGFCSMYHLQPPYDIHPQHRSSRRLSASEPGKGICPFPIFTQKAGDFHLIQVLISRQGQKLNKLVTCNHLVEYLSCRLKFTPGKLLLSKSRSNFLKLILYQLPEQLDSHFPPVIQYTLGMMNPFPDL